MIAAIIIVSIIILALLLFLAGIIYFACYVSMPHSSLESSKNWEVEHGFFRDFDKRRIEEYTITGHKNYMIHAFLVPNEAHPDSNKYVIISHGYTSSRYGALKYVNKWLELGFHCIIFDQRAHGANARGFKYPCSLGIRESKDLTHIIDDAYKRFGKDIYLGLQGESMGSASEIRAIKYGLRVHFIVADCGFAELVPVLKGAVLSLYHLPSWTIYPVSLASKILFNWSYFDNRPIDSLKNNTIPICFIHGEDDDFIVPENSKRMAEANPAYSEVHLFPGANHAESMYKDEARYLEILKAFLKKVESMEKAV